jgi:paraquat-inducible protein A
MGTRGSHHPRQAAEEGPGVSRTDAVMMTTAVGEGLLGCEACGLLSRSSAGHHLACARCGARLHRRKPGSIARTWAFLIAAYVLYIPANVLPVMETGSLFDSQRDTIMSGVVYLWKSGSWPLAVIIFIASIMIPAVKLLAMTVLLVTVQRWPAWRPHDRSRLYRIVELVGRWSMVDIYVATMLVALVQFQTLATIKAGPGAIAFGAVVVLTLFATEAFDPRLIWDRNTRHE